MTTLAYCLHYLFPMNAMTTPKFAVSEGDIFFKILRTSAGMLVQWKLTIGPLKSNSNTGRSFRQGTIEYSRLDGTPIPLQPWTDWVKTLWDVSTPAGVTVVLNWTKQ